MENHQAPLPTLPSKDRHALERVARTEAETLHAYTIYLPQVDTPELRDKLKAQVDRHHEISRTTDRLLGVLPTASLREELAMPVMTTPLGDTLDTLKALEHLENAERMSRESLMVTLDSGPSKDLELRLRAWLEDLEIQGQELSQVLKSVRAAAQLWGSPSDAPLLHH